ncbi:hypothetical protein [Taibaiella koreensis]|uniref:hypothetical protein n=1 Tax=Taibaiella koreensis TaxID=1268548 RepID=UPI000E59F677|nr:hypothetical protein [Taibaiella koreensis]
MRCFLFASLLILLFSCNRQAHPGVKQLRPGHSLSSAALRPHLEKTLYRCVVDGKFAFKKFHLSGILYLKHFGDEGDRVVFQSEMGNTFFDFGWNNQDSFRVYNIIDQMNKPALIKTLRKDFEMILVKGLSEQAAGSYQAKHDSLTYTRFNLQRGFVYYITNKHNRLTGIDNADDKRKVVTMQLLPPAPLQQLPETLTIRHLRAHFTIDLKKITPDDTAE